ncbi:MAG: EAL domain-containing protein [Aquificota bacterium]|nr:EAL domain-containing protein [Aquificota bacterium]
MEVRKEGIYLETGTGERRRIGYEYFPDLGIHSYILQKGVDEKTDLVLFKFLGASAIVEGDLERGLVFVNIKPTTLVKYTTDVVQFVRKNLVLEIQKDVVSPDILRRIKKFAQDRDVLLSVDDYGKEGSRIERIEVLQPAYVKIDLSASEDRFDFVLWAFEEIKKVSPRSQVILKNVETEEDLEKMISFGINLWQGKLERKLVLTRGP